MKRHPSIPNVLLKSLQELIEVLKIDAPLEVKRQIWLKDENAFKKALIPHIRSYVQLFTVGWGTLRRDKDESMPIKENPGNIDNQSQSIEHNLDNSDNLTSSAQLRIDSVESQELLQSAYAVGQKRKLNEPLNIISDMIGDDIQLYISATRYIKEIIALQTSKGITVERAIKSSKLPMCFAENNGTNVTFMSSVAPALASLRYDLLMNHHDRSINSICEKDEVYKFSWCLDACIGDHNFDDRRLKEMQSLLKSIEAGLKKAKKTREATRIQTRKSRGLKRLKTGGDSDDEEDEDFDLDIEESQAKHRPSAFRLKSGNTLLVETRTEHLDQSHSSALSLDVCLVLRRSNSLLALLHNVFTKLDQHTDIHTINNDKQLSWLIGFLYIGLEWDSIVENGDKWLKDNDLLPPRPKNSEMKNSIDEFVVEMMDSLKKASDGEYDFKRFDEKRKLYSLVGESQLITYMFLYFTITRLATADEEVLSYILQFLDEKIGSSIEKYPEFIQEMLFALATMEYEELDVLRVAVVDEYLMKYCKASEYIHLQLLNYLILAFDSETITFKEFSSNVLTLSKETKHKKNKELVSTYKSILDYYCLYFSGQSIDTSSIETFISPNVEEQ